MNYPEGPDAVPLPPSYHIYLLRCWQERSTEAAERIQVWRFSLEDPRTGGRRGFASLDALLASLQDDLAETTG
jgi:hypothetical protein